MDSHPNLAFAPDDSEHGAGLGSLVMAKPAKRARDKVFGPRVVAALVPRHFKDLTAIQLATGIAYSTIHDWSTGTSDPRLEVIARIAALVQCDPSDLIRPVPAETTPSARPRAVAETPGFGDMVRAAMARDQARGERIPEHVYREVGKMTSPALLARMDDVMLSELVRWWMRAVDRGRLQDLERDLNTQSANAAPSERPQAPANTDDARASRAR